MYIHEYGKTGLPVMLLLHPMEVTGEDLYRILSPYLKGQYHIIAPDLGGHGQSAPYTDCRMEAAELEQWLQKNGCSAIDLLYGASMGVTVAWELLRNGKISVRKIWFDGGGLAPDAGFMNWMMKNMFLKKLRALQKDPSVPSRNLIRMYGEEFAEMMKANFLKLSEEDIIRICYDCTHREPLKVSSEIQKNMCFEYGESDPNRKAAEKILHRDFPAAAIVVRKGYGHCGYMAFHTKAYAEELEAFRNVQQEKRSA